MSRPRGQPMNEIEKVSTPSVRKNDPNAPQNRKFASRDSELSGSSETKNQSKIFLWRRYRRVCWLLFAIFAIQGLLVIIHTNSSRIKDFRQSRRSE